MDSAVSSPGYGSYGEAINQTHADLLQAFKGFRPGRQNQSKSLQPPLASSSQQPNSPGIKASQSSQVASTQQAPPSTVSSTQDTTTRKRTRRSANKEHTEEHQSSDSDIPLVQTPKRPRRNTPKVSDKPENGSTSQEISTASKQTVGIQDQKGFAHVEKTSQALSVLQNIDPRLQAERSPATITPGFVAASIKGQNVQQMNGALHYKTPIIRFAPSTAQSSKNFATQILSENQKFAETLSRKNSTFLLSVPPTAKSYLEGKLAQITAEMTRLHQEKVDAIKLEYVAELKRDMDERQKVIDMLTRKPDV
ncbi:hypothetical protein TSTA_124570 [Talaromyces stipitatus ATCC 10500]|uniref:Uncharacterized protein n=1 Tax=Talaromyces stipitatus (strain ATCC 10500 / CBS 375.48 / QM 6759 / NRRL 1006) TaxID=441959 RepID=B8MB33_TALSN|nr:uncharacterized protein TSTA_124570 [Talaromyces stipitatus ATCC 10500]EED18734.1 hypothetical protein TSTA_124570 [Talaromyces stipitatus ATCC 10500]